MFLQSKQSAHPDRKTLADSLTCISLIGTTPLKRGVTHFCLYTNQNKLLFDLLNKLLMKKIREIKNDYQETLKNFGSKVTRIVT